MLNLNILSVTMPLTNPVLIFSVILFIILFAPLVLHRFKIPDIVGLIIAGALIGPYGLHIMDRDSSIVLFGTVVYCISCPWRGWKSTWRILKRIVNGV